MSHSARALAAGAAALALLAGACASESEPEPDATTSPSATTTTTTTEPSPSPTPPAPGPTRVTATVVSGLAVPWGLTFLTDGNALVTERDSGRVLALTRGEDGWQEREVGRAGGGNGSEGGLLGIAARPVDAAKELGPQEVFLYLTTGRDNRVLRGTYDGRRLGELTPVLTGIPRGEIHDGGRLAFGPDGLLYVATGDSGRAELAQDRSSLAGKILRITGDGDPAPGNPFGDEVWSYGHRNVQGLAWDDDGQLWASEFGQNTWDELNRVTTGGNHGWPLAEGTDGPEAAPDGTPLVAPVRVWPTDEASPSGLAFADGRLWVAALRGNRLWEVDPDAPEKAKDRFAGEYGRLRTVVATPEGGLWLTTSNRDGRGEPARSDDRILEITLGAR